MRGEEKQNFSASEAGCSELLFGEPRPTRKESPGQKTIQLHNGGTLMFYENHKPRCKYRITVRDPSMLGNVEKTFTTDLLGLIEFLAEFIPDWTGWVGDRYESIIRNIEFLGLRED